LLQTIPVFKVDLGRFSEVTDCSKAGSDNRDNPDEFLEPMLRYHVLRQMAETAQAKYPQEQTCHRSLPKDSGRPLPHMAAERLNGESSFYFELGGKKCEEINRGAYEY
jgi:hypothetical protein